MPLAKSLEADSGRDMTVPLLSKYSRGTCRVGSFSLPGLSVLKLLPAGGVEQFKLWKGTWPKALEPGVFGTVFSGAEADGAGKMVAVASSG